jgi:hypothetical protein
VRSREKHNEQKHIAFTARSKKDANSSGGVLPGGVPVGNVQKGETAQEEGGVIQNGGVPLQPTKIVQAETMLAFSFK